MTMMKTTTTEEERWGVCRWPFLFPPGGTWSLVPWLVTANGLDFSLCWYVTARRDAMWGCSVAYRSTDCAVYCDDQEKEGRHVLWHGGSGGLSPDWLWHPLSHVHGHFVRESQGTAGMLTSQPARPLRHTWRKPLYSKFLARLP